MYRCLTIGYPAEHGALHLGTLANASCVETNHCVDCSISHDSVKGCRDVMTDAETALGAVEIVRLGRKWKSENGQKQWLVTGPYKQDLGAWLGLPIQEGACVVCDLSGGRNHPFVI